MLRYRLRPKQIVVQICCQPKKRKRETLIVNSAKSRPTKKKVCQIRRIKYRQRNRQFDFCIKLNCVVKKGKKFNLVNLVFDLPLWYARVTLVTISVFYYLNFEPFIFPTGSNFFLGRETFLWIIHFDCWKWKHWKSGNSRNL